MGTCMVVSNIYRTLLELLVPPEYAALQAHELQGRLCACCDVVSPAYAIIVAIMVWHDADKCHRFQQGMPGNHSFSSRVHLVGV
jgi:hypothetical protein